MWNDTDIPLAYLITFRCYGTWLHGDERGAINRLHNQYQSPYLESNLQLHKYNLQKLKCPPVNLDASQRQAVETSIIEVCNYKNWLLRAINVRTNHIHLVVSTGASSPSQALNSFKSYATRKLRENNLWKVDHTPWASRGSNRYLWNEKSIETAVEYVVSGQGGALPEFD